MDASPQKEISNPFTGKALRVGNLGGKTDGAFALVNGVIVDAAKAKAVKGKALVIRDGRIDGIHPAKSEDIKALPKFDCRGAYLIPGLINIHCHMTMGGIPNVGLGDISALLAQIDHNLTDSIGWGVTTVRDMGSIPVLLKKLRRKLAEGKVVGPRIFSALGFVSVPGGYPEFIEHFPAFFRRIVGCPAFFTTRPHEVRTALAEFKSRGADLIKISLDTKSLMLGGGKLNILSDEQMVALRSAADEVGLPIAAHHLYNEGLERALAYGIDSLEHITTDADLTDDQIARVVDSDTPHVPTLTSRVNLSYITDGDPYCEEPEYKQAWEWKTQKAIPEISVHALPHIHRMCLDVVEEYTSGRFASATKGFHFNPPVFTKGVVLGGRNLRRLADAGAPIGVGNDAGVPLTFPGSLHQELELMVMCGLTPAKALFSATATNAKILRQEKELGSLEKGKLADVVLLDGDPLKDIRETAKVRAVFKGGNLVAAEKDFPIF